VGQPNTTSALKNFTESALKKPHKSVHKQNKNLQTK